MFGFAGIAVADDNDGITISEPTVAPATLVNDGQDHQVSVTINVAIDSSRASGGIANVHIGGASVASSDTIDSISIGANHDVSCKLTVLASQLGSDIQFPLAVLWDGGQDSFTVIVKSTSPTVPQVTFTRTMDKTSSDKGGSVTVTYRVQNTGAIDIGNLSVTDSGIGTDPIKTKDLLASGSTFEFTYSQVINADFTSLPKLTYTANGVTYTASCAAKTVSLKVEQLDVLLESSPETINSGEQAVLQCTITNSGNVKLSNVVISESILGKKMFPVFSIDPGVAKRYTWPVSLTETARFQFVIAATDDAGVAYTFKSNFVEITVSSTGGLSSLDFTANSDAIRLAEPGEVNFSFTINNKGDDPLANASVVDQDGAAVKSLGSLPAGETTFTYKTTVDKTKEFNFCLIVPNGDGTDSKIYTGPLKIEVASVDPTPSGTALLTEEPTPTASDAASTSAAGSASLGKMSSLITALLVVGVLIAVTIIVLIAMIISDKKRQRS